MATSNWKVAFKQMQQMLKDLDAYVECGDWKNAHHISNLLIFHVRFEYLYEEERLKVLRQLKGKDKK